MKSVSLLAAALLSGCVSTSVAAQPMQVTVVERASGRQLEIHRHHGRMYVVGRPGEKYAVSLRNVTGGRLLAVMSVDGVNVVSGETAALDQTGYVLDAQESADITGWRKSLDDVAAFVFTALPDSYAARTGRPENVGVIGVAVFREKVQLSPMLSKAPAAAERSASGTSDGNARKSESLGTGHGPRETSEVQYTDFERASSQPDQVITIYYDTRANLIARGIIPRPIPQEPNPFPGRFVPDPSG